MTTSVHLSGAMIPPGGEVKIEINIHTRLNISAYVAKQKANVCLNTFAKISQLERASGGS